MVNIRPEKRFIGFYWTFRGKRMTPSRPDDGDKDAAKNSFTIAMQRAQAESLVADCGGEILSEVVFQEKANRPTEGIIFALNKAATLCEKQDATLVTMFFSGKWRASGKIALARNALKCRVKYTDPTDDLAAHFAWHRHWDRPVYAGSSRSIKKLDQFTPEKYYHLLSVQMDEILNGEDSREGFSARAIAETLNRRGFPTFRGLRWTEETVRKAMPRMETATRDWRTFLGPEILPDASPPSPSPRSASRCSLR